LIYLSPVAIPDWKTGTIDAMKFSMTTWSKARDFICTKRE
jgi:hypothetical protein